MMQEKGNDMTWLVQLMYLGLFEAGVCCALWQLGDTLVVLAILALAPLFGLLSRLPRKWYPTVLRQLFGMAFIGLGLFWMSQRADGENPLDLALVETGPLLYALLLF